MIARAGERFSLVGHSYGGAIALVTALAYPERVRALALYEPTLFALVDAESPPPNDADGIRETVVRSVAALEAGDRAAAARCFIDVWMGEGAWARTPEPRKGPIAESVVAMRHWAHALMTAPAPREALRGLRAPVLLMTGRGSPASSLAVARILAATLPQVEVLELDGLGHMAPVTHPDAVNAPISRFLEKKGS